MSSPPAGPGPVPPTVVVTDDRSGSPRAREEPVDTDRWARLATDVLVAEGVTGPAELAVAFVDEDTIASLHLEHLGEAGPTDVLSFPLDGSPNGPAADPTDRPGEPRLLGDVVVCPAVARRNAVPPGGYEAELALLVVHGVLHVLGWDHADADQTAAMVARERELLGAAGLERRG